MREQLGGHLAACQGRPTTIRLQCIRKQFHYENIMYERNYLLKLISDHTLPKFYSELTPAFSFFFFFFNLELLINKIGNTRCISHKI